ncbi:MAG TPA: AAA family ATPase [Gemmataceae bacterium]|nr:AAA family ATPase [Gemmataceae bacterium]
MVHRLALTLSLADEALWQRLRQLLHLVSGWRATAVQVAGHPVRYWRLSGQLAQVQDCYARKVQHGAGDGYCSGKSAASEEATYFGCRFAKGVSRQVAIQTHRANSWIHFGTLAAGHDSFRLDKKSMFATLQRQTRAEGCLFCPAFRWPRVRDEVNDLPNVIELGKDSKFEVRYSHINPKTALGIQFKESAEDAAFLQFGPGRLGRDEPPHRRNVPAVRYVDVAGQDAALEALKSVVELPLRHAAYFEALRVAPQTGVLLYGPPGNGKTLLAKAAATESNAHLEIISGPEVLSPWVGQSEENLRGVFARARRWAPSIVLIDELDSLAPRRALLSQHHDVQILAQLLVLLDGLEARGRVVVIGTTNRLEALDPAICRPGRFDYHIEVASPDRKGRAAILRVHLAKLKTRRAFELDDVIARTDGFSGAELAALCREAGIQAIRRGLAQGLAARRLVVTQHDVRQALQSLRAKRVPEALAIPALEDLPTIASTCSATRGKD